MGRRILLIGIGRSGCTVAERFGAKMKKDGLSVSSIAMDTDETGLSELQYAIPVPMVEGRSLNSVVEALGAENISDWFPCDWDRDHTEFIKNLRMDQGSNQWRMKAFLSFVSFLSKNKNVERLHGEIDRAVGSLDEAEDVELYVVASLAGGTGSGLFLPVSFYVKQYIESIGGKIKRACAVLAMPDIYENCFTAEQRIKSYANAYTALREYNTVLLSTNASTRAEKHPPFNFKLGVEGGVPELLFDADKAEYQTPSANPFDKVYLFERVPNVLSVDTHMEILTDIVVSICNCEDRTFDGETEDLKATDAVFGGVSLVKVRYPVESIVHYIGKKQVYDCFAVELCRVHKGVMAEFERKRGEARLYGFSFEENAEQYSETFISVCDGILYEEESGLALIGRDPKLFENDTTADGVWELDYLTELNRKIEASLDCESSKSLYDVFHPPVEAEEEDEEKSKGKRKKQPKRPKLSRKQLAENATEYGNWLTEFYRHGLRCLTKGREAFDASLLAEDAPSDEFSVLTHVLTKDGKHLHPVFALLRLCLVYRKIKSLAAAAVSNFTAVDDIETAELPRSLTTVDSGVPHRTAYAKLGENRFRALALNGDNISPKIADDESLFMFDLEKAYSKLRNILKACRYKQVLEVIGELIEKYRRFIDVLCVNVSEDMAEDVKLSLRNCSADNGIVVNVGASELEKNTAWERYMRGYRENTEAISGSTSYMGEAVYHALKDYDGVSSLRGIVMGVAEDVESLLRKQCEDSPFYGEYLEKNILTAVLDACSDPRTGVTLSKVFKGRTLPIHVKMPDSYAEYKTVKNETKAILDERLKPYIEEISKGEDPRTYIEKLMYSAGEYCGVAEFADYIPHGEILLRSETENLKPYFINFINELDEDPVGYKNYLKAMTAVKTLCTRMWDPSVVYTAGREARLPYINPKMQREYETMTAKAVLFALWREDLRISTHKGEGEIFVLQHGVEIHPLCADDGESFIPKDRVDLLMLWAYSHETWVSEYAAMFDRTQKDEMGRIPTVRLGGDSNGVIRRMLATSEIISAMKKYLPALICALHRDLASDGGFAVVISRLGADTLLDYCQKGFSSSFDENFISIYNGQVKALAEAFVETAGEANAEDTLGWLREQGFFVPYDLPENAEDR